MPDAIDDTELAVFLQATVQGITGLPGNMVRPRWQPQPPIQPPAMTNWVAIGVLERIGMDYPYQWFLPNDPFDMNPTYMMRRNDRLDLLASFYGPNAGSFATELRDGFYVAQNLELLNTKAIKLREIGTIRTVSELVAESWLNRVDVPISLVREINRVYAVNSLLSAQIEFIKEYGDPETVNITLNES